METSTSAILSLFHVLVLSMSWAASSSAANESFLQCLSVRYQHAIPVYTPNNSSYTSILQSSTQNRRFLSSRTPRPQIIITPLNESHVQAAVVCCRKHGLQIRVRSGGHDFEGLSFISHVPFVLVDLVNLQSISVDVEDGTAWVEAGATNGQVYYKIAEKSPTLGFPAGVCPTVGVGGHFSGGGYGDLMRKYGLSADNIIDARIVNADGKIMKRESMGEDLFWAIRGGGGANFGVILSWKIELVPIPPTVTVFEVHKTLEEGATAVVHRWQQIAHKLPKDLYIRVTIRKVDASQAGEKTIRASFISLFLGRTEQLLPLMEQRFPELGLKPEDCIEVPWVESIPFLAGFPVNTSLHVMEMNPVRTFYKVKSDYVKEPISEIGLQGLWRKVLEVGSTAMAFLPHGGIMSEIPESEIPFPHRGGYIYKIGYFTHWKEEGSEASRKNIDRTRRLYKYMTPHVSKSPRAAYLSFRDLDLGQIKKGTASYAQAKVWGRKYFKNNFDRLVQVKSKVDPDNFFRNEQSIPPVPSWVNNKGDY